MAASESNPAPRRRPTIHDIATAAGVSKPTVSRALNGHPDVNAVTRQRVLDVAAELGYVPSAGARALRTGRHGAIGLLMPQQTWWGFGETQYGIAQEADRRQLHLLVQPPLTGPEAEKEFVTRILPALPIDGLILLMPEGMLRHVGDLARSGMPVIVIDDRATRPGIPYVGTTNREGVREAVGHLVARGRRRIAFVGAQMEAAFAQARFEGYLDGLREAGIPYAPELVALEEGAVIDPDPAGVAAVLDAEPDAVVTAWDEIAFAVLNAAHIRALRVPDDIAVVGFDDNPVARVTYPPLTTVRQPLREMGEAAVRMLLDSLDNGSGPGNVSVPTRLVVRESS
ncbi:LacI family DNA-binding transcriptional regulator [Streptomyces sp. NBC_00046]|uniref:LacI family DNA-binding transcriptional regulator n=1 Tax=unclassified Streptomyces TaxID=2593676 RepID=UPI00324E6B17